MLLEEAGEVLRVFKSQLFGRLRHRQSAYHQTFGAVDEETLDHLCGTLARDAAHHIAEIAGRQTQLRGTILHVGQSVTQLQLAVVVVGQYLLEPAQQVALLPGSMLKLSLIEQQAVGCHNNCFSPSVVRSASFTL